MSSSNRERRGFDCSFWRRKQSLHFLKGKRKQIPAVGAHCLPPSFLWTQWHPRGTYWEGEIDLGGGKAVTFRKACGACSSLLPCSPQPACWLTTLTESPTVSISTPLLSTSTQALFCAPLAQERAKSSSLCQERAARTSVDRKTPVTTPLENVLIIFPNQYNSCPSLC